MEHKGQQVDFDCLQVPPQPNLNQFQPCWQPAHLWCKTVFAAEFSSTVLVWSCLQHFCVKDEVRQWEKKNQIWRDSYSDGGMLSFDQSDEAAGAKETSKRCCRRWRPRKSRSGIGKMSMWRNDRKGYCWQLS